MKRVRVRRHIVLVLGVVAPVLAGAQKPAGRSTRGIDYWTDGAD